ncbi:26S proteasome non-ATPase regulatory subunit 1 [Portunus trituberculatus]|uniref:26S proteasome non-ATPase regulatory subunit 1 n=1 Tax=Portunus trituberculatus TaxID=210409 RepID=A0A5B7D0S5_PORTR|nr:26S proteasome non-ATPase regulatory subunit 1 [Portunus trituberculatus]
MAAQQHRGTFKWYNGKSGFGFIRDSEANQDFFVHFFGLTRSFRKVLPREGDTATFTTLKGKKGPEAREVTRDGKVERPPLCPKSPPRAEKAAEADLKIKACICTAQIVRHGGCLGLGLAAMGTQRTDVYEQLKYCLFQDDAVTGEAAGLAMGLVMLGSANDQAVSDMASYARDTQHEKILRGLAQGIALTMYGQQDQADRLITELSEDKDAILRRAAMYTVAMAYCGTASTPAMKRLLHVAVSDVDNDVRRAAVEALGFLLFRSPEQIPSMVSLLSESYNPHVRYGAAMALGVACSGTGQKEALGLLEPLTNDPVNFVRQGALIASALVLIQQTEATCPKVKDFRQLYAKVISDKHEDSIAKFGAILAQGIIDAGGRNMTISLQSRTGHTSMTSVVGMFVFTQFWYWFPLAHFLSMAFTPTCLIGLNSELKMPKMQFLSNAKPSTYGYPAPLEEKKKEVAEKELAIGGIILMRDTKPEDSEELVQPVPALGPKAEEETEPDPPEPFFYED